MNNNTVIQRAFTNMKRSGWRAYAVIFMMTVTFLISGILLSLIYGSKVVVDYFIQKPEVIGFFKEDITEEQILTVKQELEQLDYVTEVRYVSREQAMDSFIKENADKESIVENVTVNVFPAHLNVRSNSLERIPDVANYFRNNELISDVLDFGNVLPNLFKVVLGLRILGWLLLGIFTIATVFIVFLTIGITVYSQKAELIVMKLVGATNWYIRGPYLIESLVYSLIAVIISLLIILPLIVTQYHSAMTILLGDSELVRPIDITVLAIGVGIEVLFAALLALSSSYFATRRYIDR